MTNNIPCGCNDDHEEEKDAPTGEEHECCGGDCHDCGDDSQDDACGCGHDHADDSENDACGCGHNHDAPTITPEELEKLKAAITAAGYKFEETPEGEIRIMEK